MEKVSAILSNSMYFTMASTSKTKAKRNEMLMAEFLYYSRYMHKKEVRRYFGGSAAEGTNLSSSDVDKMIVDPTIFVCSKPEDGEKIKGHVFLLDITESSHGYARLVLLRTDATIPTIFDDHGYPLKDMLDERKDGKCFLSSEKIVMFWMDFLRKRQTASGPPTTSRHGPSATAVNTDIHGHIKNKVGGIIEQDFVQGLPFCRIPLEGEKWLADRVNFCWPSLETVEKLKALDCYVVAVGDKTSKHSSVEWRVSFMLWEREMVWSFNDVQLQCYVLLKALLKDQVIEDLKKNNDPDVIEELSSYHMKNIVFWESEQTETNFWRKECLITFLVRCLVRFKECILKGNLLHFIDRRKNLFFGKLQDPKIKEQILNRVENIVQNLHVYCFGRVDGMDLADIWEKCQENVEKFIVLCEERHGTRLTSEFDAFRFPVKLFHDGQASFLTNVENLLATFSTLSQYHVSLEDSNRVVDVDEGYKRSVEMFIHIRSAIIQTKELLDAERDAIDDGKYKKLVIFMDENSDIDALSGKLYTVTAILAFGKCHETLERINAIFSSAINNVYVYTGMCSDCKTLKMSEATCTQEKEFPKCVDPRENEMLVLHDLMFAKEDIPFVPGALKFECFIDRAFLLHPVVYLFYLKVLLCANQEKLEHVERLRGVVSKCSGTLHSYRHLNILGHCYFEQGWNEWAYEYYAMSLSQTGAARPNAAAVLMLVLLFQIIQKK